MKTPKEVLEVACRIIDPMREVARDMGYVIAIHGSVQRDIDLVAIPWTENAADHMELFGAIVARIGGIPDWKGWRTRPHGRMVRAIDMNGTYVDLSIMLKNHSNTRLIQVKSDLVV